MDKNMVVRIERGVSNLILKFDYNPTIIKVIKCLSRRHYDKDNKCWVVPTMDLEKVEALLKFEGIEYYIAYEQKKVEKYDFYEPKLKLFPEQKECAEFLINNKNTILNSSIGFGKTATTLITLISLKKNLNLKNCLIIVPASLKKQWCSEIEKFTDEKFNMIDGPKSKRIYSSNAFFTVVSYETYRSDFKDIKDMVWDFAVLDEIVRIKNYKSKLAVILNQIRTKYRIGISGAILENRINELYNIINFVRPDLFRSYWDFESRFLVKRKIEMGSDIKFKQVVGFKNLNHLKEIMAEFIIKKELTGLPDLQMITREVEMTAEQKKYHKEIVDEIISEIDINPNPLAKLTALRQVCNSPVLVGLEGKSNKIEELIEILKEVGDKKVIVFTQFKKFADLIYDEINNEYDCVFVSGELGTELKNDVINEWKENKQILIATDCISYGMNLQEGSVLINCDLPWNPIKLQQRIGRIHRRGQLNNCLVINLISKDSVELRVLEILNEKIALINNVLDDDIDRFNIESNKEKLMRILKG